MEEWFHRDVDHDFVEYFLTDLLNNIDQLNDLLAALTRDVSKESRKAIFERVYVLREIVNEEIEMLNELMDFRALTNAEHKITKQIETIRNSAYILQIDKIVR